MIPAQGGAPPWPFRCRRPRSSPSPPLKFHGPTRAALLLGSRPRRIDDNLGRDDEEGPRDGTTNASSSTRTRCAAIPRPPRRLSSATGRRITVSQVLLRLPAAFARSEGDRPPGPRPRPPGLQARPMRIATATSFGTHPCSGPSRSGPGISARLLDDDRQSATEAEAVRPKPLNKCKAPRRHHPASDEGPRPLSPASTSTGSSAWSARAFAWAATEDLVPAERRDERFRLVPEDCAKGRGGRELPRVTDVDPCPRGEATTPRAAACTMRGHGRSCSSSPASGPASSATSAGGTSRRLQGRTGHRCPRRPTS
jgi:hypothetical protein